MTKIEAQFTDIINWIGRGACRRASPTSRVWQGDGCHVTYAGAGTGGEQWVACLQARADGNAAHRTLRDYGRTPLVAIGAVEALLSDAKEALERSRKAAELERAAHLDEVAEKARAGGEVRCDAYGHWQYFRHVSPEALRIRRASFEGATWYWEDGAERSGKADSLHEAIEAMEDC